MFPFHHYLIIMLENRVVGKHYQKATDDFKKQTTKLNAVVIEFYIIFLMDCICKEKS